MDDTTTRVTELYGKYPYPCASGDASKRQLLELANLLRFFVLETRFNLDGLRVLDAGTGTGHRLVEAAKAFPKTRFEGVDAVPEALEIAATTARQAGLENVDFQTIDLMGDLSGLGTFDVVLCMGVLHHLSDPERGLANLVARLDDSGVMFVYVYGRLGARERMRRKRLLGALLEPNHGDVERGITLARELGFDDMEFGWNHLDDDGTVSDSLLVDAYMNVHENLYDLGQIHALLADAGCHAYMVYGISRGDQGLFFDTRLAGRMPVPVAKTDPGKLLSGDLARELYALLSTKARYRVLDLLFEPNGYTIMISSKETADTLAAKSDRIRANLIDITAA